MTPERPAQRPPSKPGNRHVARTRTHRGKNRRVVRRRRAIFFVVAAATGGALSAFIIRSGAVSPSALLFLAACVAVVGVFVGWLDRNR